MEVVEYIIIITINAITMQYTQKKEEEAIVMCTYNTLRIHMYLYKTRIVKSIMYFYNLRKSHRYILSTDVRIIRLDSHKTIGKRKQRQYFWEIISRDYAVCGLTDGQII